jgi:hypothetical protein
MQDSAPSSITGSGTIREPFAMYRAGESPVGQPSAFASASAYREGGTTYVLRATTALQTPTKFTTVLLINRNRSQNLKESIDNAATSARSVAVVWKQAWLYESESLYQEGSTDASVILRRLTEALEIR